MLATYAIEVMVLYIINIFHNKIDWNYWRFFKKFIQEFDGMDFNNKLITICGILDITWWEKYLEECKKNEIKPTKPEYQISKGNKMLIMPRQLMSMEDSFDKLGIDDHRNRNQYIFNKKYINIVDPIDSSNNIGRSVSKINSDRICNVFSIINKKIENNETYWMTIKNIFGNLMKNISEVDQDNEKSIVN